MKAKALVSYYPQEAGFTIHRVYLEPDFEQAELNLTMIQNGYPSQSWKLEDVELYNSQKVVFEK